MAKVRNALGWLRYTFDNYMSRGGRWLFVIFIALFVFFVIVMFLLRLILSLFLPSETRGVDSGPAESAIVAFLQTFDPGYMAGELSSSQWFLGAAVIAGLGGIILVAVLIAFTDSAVEDRLAWLRKGKSPVVEDGHTLILGWDEQRVVGIIQELAMANEKSAATNKRRAGEGKKCAVARRNKQSNVVVVLADQDKDYMDDYLKRHLKDAKPVKCVTRSGNPYSTIDLEVVSPSTARSAIILSECSYAASDVKKEEADGRVLMTLLAIESLKLKERLSIVVDLFRLKARRTSCRIHGHSVEAIDLKEILARILLQTSRSVGLSAVLDQLLSFEGAEIYVTNFTDDPLQGTLFRDASRRFSHGVPIGIKSDDGVTLNPDPDTKLKTGNQLIILAEDDSKICLEPQSNPVCRHLGESSDPGETESSDALLLIGWGPKTKRLLDEYVNYVNPVSTVHIMKRVLPNTALPKCVEEDIDRDITEYTKKFKGSLDVSILEGDPTDPSTWKGTEGDVAESSICRASVGDPAELSGLDKVDPHAYDHIIILSDGDRGVPADVVDAKTAAILLLLREATLSSKESTTVVAELVEPENQVVVPGIGVHDFVISNRIVSMLFAQVSEDPSMHGIYRALFQEKGARIQLKSMDDYGLSSVGGKVRFCDLMKTATDRGEICIGVKAKKDQSNPNEKSDVHLAPDRGSDVELNPGDMLIVLSRSHTEHSPSS